MCALVRNRRLDALTVYVQGGGVALIGLITLAAFVYFEKFNFVQQPLQTIYLGHLSAGPLSDFIAFMEAAQGQGLIYSRGGRLWPVRY